MADIDLHKVVGEIQTDMKWVKQNLSSIDRKYSGKWVEVVMKGVIGTILLTVLGALLALVITGGASLVAYTLLQGIS